MITSESKHKVAERTISRIKVRWGFAVAVLMLAAGLMIPPSRTAAKNVDKLSEKDRSYAVKHLKDSREKFLMSVAGLSEAQLRFKQAPDRWSIAEIIEHLTLAEDFLFGFISEKALRSPATPDKERKITDEMLLAAVTDRSNKAQAPEQAKPAGRWAEASEALKEFNKRRARTISFVESTPINLRNHFASFGGDGEIDALQWTLMISAHSERHTAQINEVKADPKFPDDNKPELIDREKEIEMALSAAPEHLRKAAAVYALQRGGYVKAREGSNEFTCLVEREGVKGTSPICFDKEGAETTLLMVFRKMQLIEQGKDKNEVERVIDVEYRAGKLLAPRKPGVAYMLSTEFKTHDHKSGKMVTVFPPHVMFYAPYMKNSDIGARPEHRGSQSQPWILNEGKPWAYIIVVPKEKQ